MMRTINAGKKSLNTVASSPSIRLRTREYWWEVELTLISASSDLRNLLRTRSSSSDWRLLSDLLIKNVIRGFSSVKRRIPISTILRFKSKYILVVFWAKLPIMIAIEKVDKRSRNESRRIKLVNRIFHWIVRSSIFLSSRGYVMASRRFSMVNNTALVHERNFGC